jgi:hypothetical protein
MDLFPVSLSAGSFVISRLLGRYEGAPSIEPIQLPSVFDSAYSALYTCLIELARLPTDVSVNIVTVICLLNKISMIRQRYDMEVRLSVKICRIGQPYADRNLLRGIAAFPIRIG